MLRLPVFALAICLPGNAQFSGLATSADGSRVYFATALRQKNTTQPVYGKLFTVDSAGLKLFLSRDAQIPPPPAPGTNSGTQTNAYDLQAASVSSDGKVFAASAIRGCVGGGYVCNPLERYFTTLDFSLGQRQLAGIAEFARLVGPQIGVSRVPEIELLR